MTQPVESVPRRHGPDWPTIVAGLLAAGANLLLLLDQFA